MKRTLGLVWAVAVLGGCSPTGTVPSVSQARVYPTTGQTPEQQAGDSYACMAWAQQQSAKSSGVGGVLGEIGGAVTGAGTAGYGQGLQGSDRAFTVCMNGRGYSVYWQ